MRPALGEAERDVGSEGMTHEVCGIVLYSEPWHRLDCNYDSVGQCGHVILDAVVLLLHHRVAVGALVRRIDTMSLQLVRTRVCVVGWGP